MGTNAAVHLANLFMAKVIDAFVKSRPNVYFYRRYMMTYSFSGKEVWKNGTLSNRQSIDSTQKSRLTLLNLLP